MMWLMPFFSYFYGQGIQRQECHLGLDPKSIRNGYRIGGRHDVCMSVRPLFCLYIGALCTLLVTATAISASSREDRIIAQEQARLERAQNKKRSWLTEKLLGERRKNMLLEREATIAAWQERAAQQNEQDASFGKFAHLFPVPAWPRPLQFSFEPDQLRVEYSVSRANRGTNKDGAVVDIAQLALGGEPQIQDILLASKMATASGATPAVGYEFLQDLAKTKLNFMASHIKRQVVLSYAHGVMDNALTLGVELPLVEQMRHLRVWPDVSDAARSNLRDRQVVEVVDGGDDILRNDVFRDLYGINVQNFLEDVLVRKGMRFDPHVHQFSVGDVTAYATVSLFPQRLERLQCGVSVEIPVATDADERFFYPLELGNGGFVAARAYAGALTKETNWGYLHGMISCKVALPATVTRRVARKVVLPATESLSATEVFGQEVTFAVARDVNEPEVLLAQFAGQTTRITLRPGIETDIRLGSVIPGCVFEALQADIFYHFHSRTADTVYKNLPIEQWDTSPFSDIGLRMQHCAGVHLTYQPSDHVELRAGLNGVFVARALPLTWSVMTALSYHW